MKETKKYITDFLFSTPTILGGAGTVMNLGGNYYEFNDCETGEEADRIALENDFKMVGQDISEAIQNIKNQSR